MLPHIYSGLHRLWLAPCDMLGSFSLAVEENGGVFRVFSGQTSANETISLIWAQNWLILMLKGIKNAPPSHIQGVEQVVACSL